MTFNDIELERIKKLLGGFCQNRIPDDQRSQVLLVYEVHEYDVKIIESRPCSIGSYL